MSTNTNAREQTEVGILARILGNGDALMPPEMARYVLTLGFDEADKARMHDLAVRNQEDGLSPSEKGELLGYAKAGSLLALFKSKARRALRVKARKRSPS